MPRAQDQQPVVCCSLCNRPGRRRITNPWNRNGNAGRPYYHCTACAKFITFADERGNNASNPVCDCGTPSRSQLNGRDSRPARGVHFVCRTGRCDFFERAMVNGKQAVVSEDLVEKLAKLSII